MNNPVRRSSGARPVQRTGADDRAPTLSTDGTQWNQSVLDIATTGVDPAPEAGPVIHSALVARPGVRRGPAQTWYRSRVGWIAQQHGVTLVEARQPLAALPDGRFRPDGSWANATVLRCAASDRPTRRVGEVAADDATGAEVHPQPPTPGASGRVALPADLDYLPLALRRGLDAAAADPMWFEAEAVRFTRPDGSSYHSVGAIKVNEHEAVSLLASRQSGSATWHAEQVHFRYTATDAVAVPR